MSKLIYIASPYTHEDPNKVEANFDGITRYVATKVAEGEVLLSPITYGHVLLNYKEMPSSWEFWQNFCFTLLEKCDCVRVVKMPGWDKSTGVAAEIRFAEEYGIPVEYVEFDVDVYEEQVYETEDHPGFHAQGCLCPICLREHRDEQLRKIDLAATKSRKNKL